MIVALLVGLTVGFFLSIPPGPIAVAVMRHAIDGHYKPGLKIGAGASTMDTIYSLVAIFASSALIASLKDALMDNGWWRVGFQVACIVTLVVLGVRYFNATTRNVADTEQEELRQEEKARKMGFSSAYFLGILMSVTNLASPTFIPSLIAVASYLHANGLVDNSVGESVLYAIGFGGGAWLWFLVLLRTIYRWRNRLSPSFISRLYRFAGLSFIIFAVILAVNVIVNSDWGEMLGG